MNPVSQMHMYGYVQIKVHLINGRKQEAWDDVTIYIPFPHDGNFN